MPEHGIPTNNDYTIGNISNSQYYTNENMVVILPPSLFLHRSVGHTPPTDSRGTMTCDCVMGNDCCNYDHWKHRWVLVHPHSGECDSCNLDYWTDSDDES